jgi:EAL domain-containing protein (putative c-di-GMP-specific phosphodiesterase class I)
MRDRYYLESSSGQGNLPRRLELDDFPATVGRHPDCALNLNVDRISRLHARFEQRDGEIWLEDLGSTNGTFVNHAPVEVPTRLAAGDVIHLADHEFRLMRESAATRGPERPVSSDETVVGMQALPRHFPLQMAAFIELLDQERVEPWSQAIHTADGQLYGYELLGRSAHPDLSEGPGQLFALAATLDAEVRLSQMLRRKGFEAAARAGVTQPLFFNNHPRECQDFDQLLAELSSLKRMYPGLRLVFEVHEAAVTDLAAMAEVRRELRALDIALAYDDFGAGQARLLELVEVPPDYLKFDIALVRGLEDSESPKYRLLSALNSAIGEMGIRTLAEGIEQPAEARCCREIGIDLMQGFLFARPAPVASQPD